MYDTKLIRRERFNIPVVCVGNITVGGTGKTPFIEHLIPQLSKRQQIAVLSRGYGRRTKGYLEVREDSSFMDVGDEPKQIKRKFPDTIVVVCEDRSKGIHRIMKEHPEVGLILMDDGFQHKRVNASLDILLMDYTRPIYEDHLLPWGNLRDLRSQVPRASIVVVTKVPRDLSPIDRRIAQKSLNLYPYQSLFFTSMVHGSPTPVFPENPELVKPGRNIAVLAGIGNPKAMISGLDAKYDLRGSFVFRDHHVYKVRELKKIEAQLAQMPEDTVVITTEKDAVKLSNRSKVPAGLQKRLYVIPVRVEFHEGDAEKFIKTIYENVKHY